MDDIVRAWEAAAQGTVAVIDCRERIPCNPCESACTKGAIEVGADLCGLPRYDPGRCDGCGRCAALCPGMAIFLLDRSTHDGKARVTVPYEMKEQVRKGEEAWAMDAAGVPLGKGKVIRAAKTGREDRSLLVTLEVPEEWALKVRGLRVRVMTLERPRVVRGRMREEDRLLCRCEEVCLSRAREYAMSGFHALGALRRTSRAGMGYCQGRFCQEMLAVELAAAAAKAREDVGTFKVRPPVRPVKLSRLGGDDG